MHFDEAAPEVPVGLPEVEPANLTKCAALFDSSSLDAGVTKPHLCNQLSRDTLAKRPITVVAVECLSGGSLR